MNWESIYVEFIERLIGVQKIVWGLKQMCYSLKMSSICDFDGLFTVQRRALSQYIANPSTDFFQFFPVTLSWVIDSPHINRFHGDRFTTSISQSPGVPGGPIVIFFFPFQLFVTKTHICQSETDIFNTDTFRPWWNSRILPQHIPAMLKLTFLTTSHSSQISISTLSQLVPELFSSCCLRPVSKADAEGLGSTFLGFF